jgi:MacB-like periplasmic core domain/FtsX-like permease family
MPSPGDRSPLLHRRQQVLRRVVVPALAGLRMYPRSAALLATLGAAALAVALPIALLAVWRDGIADTSLLLAPPGDAGAMGPGAVPAVALQHTALLFFFRLLLTTAAGGLLVAVLAALGLAAARASQRSAETTVRRAVGATTRLLIAGLLVEGAVIAVLALLFGSATGASFRAVLLRGWPDGSGPIDPSVGLLAVLATGLLLTACMVLPVLFARRVPLGAPSTRPVPLFLPALQLGLSLIVLVSGALLAHHATRLLGAGPVTAGSGTLYQITGGTTARTALSRSYRSVLTGVTRRGTASLTGPGALLGAGPTNRITTDCGLCSDGGLPTHFHRATVTQQVVSADSFQALGLPVVAGRGFSPLDTLGAPLVAVVGRSLAAAHFQFGQPLGRSLRIQEGAIPGAESEQWYQVVGVVEDRRSIALGGGFQPAMAVYLSILQRPTPAAELLIRPAPDAGSAAGIGLVLQESFGSDGASVRRTSETALVAREAARLSWFAHRFGMVGWVMLALATIGTMTIMHAWVTSLRPELGLRRAVGASGGQLLRLILGMVWFSTNDTAKRTEIANAMQAQVDRALLTQPRAGGERFRIAEVTAFFLRGLQPPEQVVQALTNKIAQEQQIQTERHRVEVARLQSDQQRLLNQTRTAEALTKQYLGGCTTRRDRAT